jgi:hypothetical protein
MLGRAWHAMAEQPACLPADSAKSLPITSNTPLKHPQEKATKTPPKNPRTCL